jgi:hypothetical protein
VGDFEPFSNGCLFLLLWLWACGQRVCVVHHVHIDVSRTVRLIGMKTTARRRQQGDAATMQ